MKNFICESCGHFIEADELDYSEKIDGKCYCSECVPEALNRQKELVVCF